MTALSDNQGITPKHLQNLGNICSPSDAGLRTAITLALAEGCHFYHIREQRAVEDRVLALFQAREQQVLTELLGQQKVLEEPWGDGGGKDRILAVPVEAIEKYREGL